MNKLYETDQDAQFEASLHARPHRLMRLLVGPVPSLTQPIDKRFSTALSLVLLFVTISMIAGSLLARFALGNTEMSRLLALLSALVAATYAVSRTRRYKAAIPMQLAAYFIWPAASLAGMRVFNSDSLFSALTPNVLIILLSSVFLTLRATIALSILNALLIFLLPLAIPEVNLQMLLMPIAFNIVGTILVLILTRMRNLNEQDRMKNLSDMNERLREELEERKRAEAKMSYSATHDSLTDLPNRSYFMDKLYDAMERSKWQKNYMFSVLFLDLDRFKVVNDSLGHYAGDQLLIETASRLSSCLRAGDIVARMGGDEFAILLEELRDSSDSAKLAERIRHDLSQPCEVEGRRVYIFASIGIVTKTDSYEQPEDILRDADIAMYRAKERGVGGYEIFDPSMLERAMGRLELETYLRKSLENDEILVHFQPIFNLENMGIVGFEALARWNHPDRGIIPPAEFIPIAEETGLIVPIGYSILERACLQLKRWQDEFPSSQPLSVSVNWSIRQFLEVDMTERIAAILRKTGIDPKTLNLELTESLIVEDAESAISRLKEIRALGVQVHIDDFGTGYSSLGYLHVLPIDTLKIDRSFINRLNGNEVGSEIVKSILALAHELGLKVVAEGVETQEQLDSLKSMHCEFVQGFLFAHPTDEREVHALLERRKHLAA